MINDDQHIMSAFDRDLETVQALIVRMGGLVEQAILNSAKALERRDEDLADTVRVGDKAIDNLMEQVNEECARVIAQRAPVASDLRTLLTAMRFSASLNRIGDYAKNIARRSIVLSDSHSFNGTEAALRRMANSVEAMLHDCLDAFIQRDEKLAEDVRHRDLEVDQMYDALFRELLTFMLENPRNISACMHLHFIAKNIERQGDLVTNLAEQVIYLVTGGYPDDDRPKGPGIIDVEADA